MRIWVCVVLWILSSQAMSQLIFRGDLEQLKAPPLFAVNNGAYELPNEPAANQLQWILDQLAASETSIADINAHFSPAWLASVDAQQTQNFIAAVRADYPNAVITDLVALTAMHAFVFIEGQDANANTGTILLEVSYTGGQLITALGVNGHNGNLQYPEDMTLTLAQAINKFTTFAADTGLLIAYINDDEVCQTIAAHQADTLLATGSLFKPWVLGGLADEVEAGNLTALDDVEFIASERVFNNTLVNREPFWDIIQTW